LNSYYSLRSNGSRVSGRTEEVATRGIHWYPVRSGCNFRKKAGHPHKRGALLNWGLLGRKAIPELRNLKRAFLQGIPTGLPTSMGSALRGSSETSLASTYLDKFLRLEYPAIMMFSRKTVVEDLIRRRRCQAVDVFSATVE